MKIWVYSWVDQNFKNHAQFIEMAAHSLQAVEIKLN